MMRTAPDEVTHVVRLLALGGCHPRRSHDDSVTAVEIVAVPMDGGVRTDGGAA